MSKTVQQLGQLFIMGIQSTSLNQEEINFITKNEIGGVILFTRNYESIEQLWDLIGQIRELQSTPMFISIDMEGGRVARLKAPLTVWPPLCSLGKSDSTSLAYDYSFALGSELSSFGINMNFNPCLDVLTNLKNEVIGDRALSNDPEQVAKIGSSIIRGHMKSGVLPCGKHFPGHGNTLLDSHEDLPFEEKTLEQLEACELIPFKKSFRTKLTFLMTAHIQYNQIDNEYPATLSKKWITDILKSQMGYRGFVMTDDLDMKALTKSYSVESIPLLAMDAGADILLYCNNFESPKIGFESLEKAISENKISSDVLQAKVNKVLDFKNSKLADNRMSLDEIKALIGCEAHQEISSKMKQYL